MSTDGRVDDVLVANRYEKKTFSNAQKMNRVTGETVGRQFDVGP